MRTTVNIKDEALELCKEKARESESPLGEVISEAIFMAYREKAAQERARQYELPVSGAGGLQPGIDLDDWVALEDRLEDRV